MVTATMKILLRGVWFSQLLDNQQILAGYNGEFSYFWNPEATEQLLVISEASVINSLKNHKGIYKEVDFRWYSWKDLDKILFVKTHQ